MGQTTDQIEADIDRSREDLKANLEELEARAHAATDWRSQFEKRPGVLIAAAVAGGILLSSLLGRR